MAVMATGTSRMLWERRWEGDHQPPQRHGGGLQEQILHNGNPLRE